MQQLILGSSSPFRAELLAKLQLPFTAASPDIDEKALADETAEQLVKRLSEQKAKALADNYPNSLIIGSDQAAILGNTILGKPSNYDNAFEQLKNASGQTVRFLTGLALYNSQTQQIQSIVEPFDVVFKTLSDQQISFYLHKEEPYQCAGSFKSEGFGISLFDQLKGDDPNSLIGLPLIQLIKMLEKEGIDVLSNNE